MRKENKGINFWKIIFSIVIVFFHGHNLSETGDGTPFIWGNMAVEFFFLVSAILMAGSVERKREIPIVNLGEETFLFMKRKVLRLLPEIWVAIPIAFIVEHNGKFKMGQLLKDAIDCMWEFMLISECGARTFIANKVYWYISAMLLVMLLMYPLMRKYKDSWYYIIAPLTFLFLLGYTYQNYKSLGTPHDWNGFFYKSVIRAAMDMCLGTICYKIGIYLQNKEWKTRGKIMLTLVEIGSYLICLLYMYRSYPYRLDWNILIIMAVGVTCTFVNNTYTVEWCNGKILAVLGAFSYPVYLSHGFWSRQMRALFPGRTYIQLLPIYLVLTLVTALFVSGSASMIRKKFKIFSSK